MEYNIPGRSGLKVSVVGLGCGGPSRLGWRANNSEDDGFCEDTAWMAMIEIGLRLTHTTLTGTL